MAQVKLTELAIVIRSKNAGPYELTFDIIFKSLEVYQQVKTLKLITANTFAHLYGVDPTQVIAFVEFDPAHAIKATLVRPRPSGDLGETDVYGAQQHAPLLNLLIEMPRN